MSAAVLVIGVLKRQGQATFLEVERTPRDQIDRGAGQGADRVQREIREESKQRFGLSLSSAPALVYCASVASRLLAPQAQPWPLFGGENQPQG